jgi:hypothetical protein
MTRDAVRSVPFRSEPESSTISLMEKLDRVPDRYIIGDYHDKMIAPNVIAGYCRASELGSVKTMSRCGMDFQG